MFVNRNGQVLGISDIPLSWLCPRCRTLISDYCTAAKTVDRVSLDPASDSILTNIMRHTKTTRNPILRALYRDLKAMIRTILNQPERKKGVFQLLMQIA